MQKFSTCVLDQDVPEEDIEVTQEEDQLSSGNQENQVNITNNQDQNEPEHYQNSLFSFNFLNDENSNSPKPKEHDLDSQPLDD